MEGTYTTTDELILTEAGIIKKQKPKNIEVANYTLTLAWVVKKLQACPYQTG